MSKSDKDLFTILRHDLTSFIEYSFEDLNPGTKFQPNWHVQVLAAYLEACRLGKIKRLIVNMPPRYLKSLCTSVAFTAFWLGHSPSAQIINICYGQDLADKFSRDTRAIMQTPWYQRCFPTRLNPARQSVGEFETTKHGFRKATSVGGVLTGRGGDVIILDDVLKPDQALSEVERRSVNEWQGHTLLSRLNDKAEGCFILIMQRLYQNDLVGHLIEQGGWTVLSFPAIAEQDEEYVVETAFGTERFTRKRGQALHPERESLEDLESFRRQMGEYNFAAQYQQSPVPLGGGLIKRAWFRTYEPHELPETFDQVLQSWDTASKPNEFADWSVCTTWGIKGKILYLLHVFRERVDHPGLKRAVKRLALEYRATVVLIEDKASGTSLIQDLVDEGIHGVQGYKPEGDKIMRMNAQSGTIEEGFVYIPTHASWLDAYLLEVTSFPYAKYDDQADSTSQALDWVKRAAHFPGRGLFDYFRLQSEAMTVSAAKSDKLIRFHVPPPTTDYYTLTGRHIAISDDRIIEATEEEAPGVIANGGVQID